MEQIKGTIKCGNPMCITNHEPVETLFDVYEDTLKCHYCGKCTDK